MGLRAKEIRKGMGTLSVYAKDAGKGKRENEINKCLGGLPGAPNGTFRKIAVRKTI